MAKAKQENPNPTQKVAIYVTFDPDSGGRWQWSFRVNGNEQGCGDAAGQAEAWTAASDAYSDWIGQQS